MHDSSRLDELDLQLINALQVDPRAPWNLVGDVLGVDAATAARRWARLTAAGLAWITAHPVLVPAGDVVGAFIEMRCSAGRAGAVADQLADDPRVGTIEHVTGASDLRLMVFAAGLAELSTYVLNTLGGLSGVRSCRTHVMTSMYAEGSRWQLHALDAVQRNRLRAPMPAEPAIADSAALHDTELLTALQRDGRASFSDLAESVQASASTVRRRVRALIASRSVVTRCDVAQTVSGWPVSATMWCRVNPAQLERVARQLASLRETRMCASVIGGRPNLLLSMWLQSAADIHRLEALLHERVPDAEVIEVALSLRHVKRLGRILDERGFATRFVPMNVC